VHSKPVAGLPRVRFGAQRLPEHIEAWQVRAFDGDLNRYLRLRARLVLDPRIKIVSPTD
jgi:hypothetical protein